MIGSPASPFQGDLIDMFGIKSSFWPPPWSLLILAVIGLIVWWYCKQHIINVLSLFTSSSHHNTQEKLKTDKKNNKKNVFISMSEGYGPVSSFLSTKKSRQSFGIKICSILVAAFLIYALSDLTFKARHFDAAVVEVGNILPPASLPLDLPPPPPSMGIVGEVAIEEASSEYEDISSSFSPHTPKALASFLKDNAASLLRGATVQTFLLSPDSKEGEEDVDGIVRVGTPEVASGSDDSLSSFKSGFHRVELIGYDQMPFGFSGRVRTLFQSLGHSDGGPSSSTFFSMASLKSKAVGFLSGATPAQDIFEKSVEEDTTSVSLSISDEFATQTEDRVNGFVGNMDVGELKRNTSIKYASCTCPTDVHLRYKHPADKDGDGQHLGGLTKWINHFLLASSNDNRDGSCMKVSEASGDWPYSTDESTNSYQDEAVYSLLKKASNPTILGGLDVDSATKKASLLDVFSDKCVESEKVSFLMNKAVSFIKNRTTSLLPGATAQRYLDLQQQLGVDLDDDSLRVEIPVEGAPASVPIVLLPLFKSGFQLGLKGYDPMSFDSDTPSVPSPNGDLKEVRSLVGLDESMKVQQHKSSLPWWYQGSTMMVTLILGVILVNWRSSPVSVSLLSFVSSDADMNAKSSRMPIRSFASFKRSAKRLISLLALAVSGILSSPINALELDSSAGGLDQKDSHSIAVKEESAFGFTEMMKPLSNVERRLRGSNEPLDTKEAADMFSTLHDSASKYSELLNTLQEQHKNGDDEGFAATIKALMSDMNQPEFKTLANEAASLTYDSSLSSALDQLDSTQLPDDFSLDSIPASSIINMFNKMVSQDFFGDLADRSNDLRDELSKSQDALEEYHRRLSEDKEPFQHDNFDFSSQEDPFGHNFDFSGNNFAGFNNKFNRFGGFNLNSHPSFKRFFSPHHSSMTRHMKKKGGFSASRHLKKVFNKAKAAQGAAPRDPNRRSRRLQNDDTCPTVCRPEDRECNCKDLVKYALKMTAYDVLIMLTRGNIDTDVTSDDFGHLTGDVNLFTDTDGFVPQKVNRIKSLAKSMNDTEDYSRCDELLEEFHTACDPQAPSCPANNTQSFQLNIEQVRASVKTAEKMIFTNMTLFDGPLFDGLERVSPFEQPGFNEEIMAWYASQRHNVIVIGLVPRNCRPTYLVQDAGLDFVLQTVILTCRRIMATELNRIIREWNEDRGVLCQSISYTTVNEFGYEFSRLYEGRNRDTHPDGNPMELHTGEPVHDVDPTTLDALGRMRFPTAYNFQRTDHGVKHLQDEPARYEFASNLEDFPGTSSRTTGTWQINIYGRVYYYSYSLDEGCFSSQRDKELVSNAMSAADESLALLVGKLTSVGTIRRYAALVNDQSIPNSSQLLPGTCCLDTALNSEFLGYNFDPDNEDMNCIDPGPYHLGMSPEACENGGGHWDRSPCHTLKKCIDDRPEPETSGVCANDITISCQDNSECPTILGTGTCAGSSQECAGDDDCSGDSTCINRSEDIQPECHYFPGYGNCREDPSIQCRVDSDCPLTTSETGTCNGANTNASPQACSSDSDCQSNSKCEFNESPTECLYNVGPIEEYAQDLVIDDAADLARCEEVREELGYKADHLDDIEICESFVDLRCNPDGIFEFLEQEVEDVPITIGATPASYNPPEYDPDEELMKHDFPDRGGDSEYNVKTLPDQEALTIALDTFKIAKTILSIQKDVGKEIIELQHDYQDHLCQTLMGQCSTNGIGPGLFYCALGNICFVILNALAFWGYYSHHTALIAYHLTELTYESMAISKNSYDKYAYLNQKASDKWTDTALRNLQTDMLNQHTVVRRDLQERHRLMEVSINEYTMCATNHILYETTKAIAEAHGPGVDNDTPSPTPECIDVLNLPSSSRRRLAEGKEEEGVNEISLTLPQGYKGVRGELDDIEKDVDEVVEKEDRIIFAMKEIMEKLDMDPAVLDLKKKKPKTPKKPKHAKASEHQEEAAQGTEGDLFKRNLLAVEEVVNDKFDDMQSEIEDMKSQGKMLESKVDSIEGKVKSVESKVESIEGKVEKIEKTMEEMKEMLSQLMMRGAADA